jgi:hypothetical protein
MAGFESSITKVLSQRLPGLGSYGFVPGSLGNFYSGDFGLFVTSKLTDKTSVLSEIVFEEDDAQSNKVGLRRLLLEYDYNEHLKMSLGRYQTNIGYYYWAFRSAAAEGEHELRVTHPGEMRWVSGSLSTLLSTPPMNQSTHLPPIPARFTSDGRRISWITAKPDVWSAALSQAKNE